MWYRDRDSLEAEGAKYTSWAEVARAHNLDPRTIQRWAKRHDLLHEQEDDPHLEAQRLRTVQHRKKVQVETKERARTELLIEAIERSVRSLPPVQVDPPSLSLAGAMSPMTLVCHRSDMHFGEMVDPEQTLDLNAYNVEIACRRTFQLEQTIRKALEVIAHAHPVPSLRLFYLGDIGSGQIHDELIETNELDAYETWALWALVEAQFILRLAPLFQRITIEGVPGNHGRMTKKKHAKNRYVNWDFLSYQLLSLLLMNQPNVHCSFPRSPFQLTTCEGWGYLLYHGDDIRSWQSIPWYGIERAIAKLRELFQARHRYFEYVALAHFHNAAQMDRARGKLIVNGSQIGGNEYSIGGLYVTSRPTQALYFLHPEHGITWSLENDLSRGDLTPHPYAISLDGDSLADAALAAL